MHSVVMPGLDPGIHLGGVFVKKMDCLVEPTAVRFSFSIERGSSVVDLE
jgi:hypothetical protein